MLPKGRSPVPIVLAFLLVPIFTSAQECSNLTAGLSAKSSLAILQTSSGSSIVHLESSESGDVTVNLSAGPFVSQTTGGVVSGAVAFTAGDGSGAPPKSLAPGGSVDVVATVTNEGAVGLSTANIFNAGRCIGQLKAVRYDAPLNFTLEGAGSANAPLRIEDGRDVPIQLKNNDDLTYSIVPSLYLDGEEIGATPASLTLGPNTVVLLHFKTSPKWFDWGTCFRPRTPPLLILLRPNGSAFGDVAAARALTSRPIPVNAQLASLSTNRTELVSSGLVFVVLLLGGLASLAINSLLPNLLKRLSYKKTLRALADATSGVSIRVDSRLRVLLRLERNRLLKLLTSSNLFWTDATDVFQQVDSGLTALSKRVTIAQRLDELRNRFDLGSSVCPPSISNRVDECLQQAADQLRSLWVTDQIIDNANSSLDSAEQKLNALAKTDFLAKDIAARHAQLLARAKTFPDEALAPFKDALPGIFEVLSASYDDTHPVLPGNFMQVDDSVARVNVALDSIYVYASTTDPGIQGRLKARREQLLRLLGTRDWRTLRAARALVEQMRQNIYPQDLMDAVRAEKASITVDQQVARPYSPLELCICFDTNLYNRAKALRRTELRLEFRRRPHRDRMVGLSLLPRACGETDQRRDPTWCPCGSRSEIRPREICAQPYRAPGDIFFFEAILVGGRIALWHCVFSSAGRARWRCTGPARRQFFAPSNSSNSFLRWAADLNHTLYIYGYTRAAPRASDATGPDSCAPGGQSCPAISRTRNLNGSVNLRLFVSESINSATSAVPFYFQPTLGGQDINNQLSLSSYQDYRFRAPNVLLLQESFEHSIWGPFGLKLMADQGRVAVMRSDLGFNHLKHSFAAGLTLRAGAFPMVSLMFAWGGSEGHHTIANMNTFLLGGSSRPLLD